MSALPDAVRALYGAWRLARFDSQGHDFFDKTTVGFWRSFQAAFILAPLYLLLLAAQAYAGQVDLPFGRYLALELSAYFLSWLVFPVVMEWLTRTLGCRDRYIPFIVAYNWAMVPQYVLFIGVIVLGLIGLIPTSIVQGLTTLLFIWTLVYSGYIAKTALLVPLSTTAGIVFLDVLLGLLLNQLITG
ncbi:MAG: hypothetical protein HQ483_14200 [Rhodospirillales bacterium]|nr:hypothetical protein [Rhodospirillales bacterium]